MKIEAKVIGYKKGVSKAGKNWLKLSCMYSATGSDKCDAVGSDVLSTVLVGDDVDNVMKATSGHLVGSTVTVIQSFAGGKEFIAYVDIKGAK